MWSLSSDNWAFLISWYRSKKESVVNALSFLVNSDNTNVPDAVRRMDSYFSTLSGEDM